MECFGGWFSVTKGRVENPIPKFSLSRLKFVRLGSNCRVEVGGGQTFFESQDSEN